MSLYVCLYSCVNVCVLKFVCACMHPYTLRMRTIVCLCVGDGVWIC